MTRSQTVAADVSALLRARNPLIWVVTREEARVERHLVEAAGAAGYIAKTWDVCEGACEVGGKPVIGMSDTQDPGQMLGTIKRGASGEQQRVERSCWIMRDLPPWLEGQVNASTCRSLRNLARLLPTVVRDKAQAVIVLTPSSKVPEELAGHVTVVEWPLPDREEIGAMFDAAIEILPDGIGEKAAQDREAAVDAAVGLTGDEAMNCFAKSLVQTKRIDPVAVAQEKRRVIAREKVLEWFDPLPGGLNAVGGLANLKAWLVTRSMAYTPEARAYGLPSPKGAMLVGIPGCGKSLTAKAIATAWNVPLLRLDMGALRSKFVGESEQNLRKAFTVIEAIGRCVVWLDEVEKALQGATSGSADGGVSADALGAVLSWMQDRRGEAFVVATANDVQALPPELLRKGRFDEVWFVGLPTLRERASIVEAALKAHGRNNDQIGIEAMQVAANCHDFTGAEIAAIVPDAMFVAFSDGRREITTTDLIYAAKTVEPLAKTAKTKIDKLLDWGKSNARAASVPDELLQERPQLRAIDL